MYFCVCVLKSYQFATFINISEVLNQIKSVLQQIVPPVINSFGDQDSRVRYYACEALYNIAKVRMNSDINLL